ncbi:MAG: PrsW family intramembrane metalloprotease [Eubacteriaceae bacterium]|nr:PrsW family intramembrane metalloprotease [Eubacteriaceae bacterium]
MTKELFIALLPTVVIVFFLLRFDKYKKEPLGLLVLLFIAGVVTAVPAVVLEQLYVNLFGNAYSPFQLVMQAFFGVALVEESVKFIACRLIAYRKKSYDELYDGIIYCSFVSLGFATIENILYVNQYGFTTALVRAVTAVPAHAIFGVLMGYFLSLSKFVPEKRGFYRALSLISPVFAHGVYDAILFLDLDWALLIFLPFMVLLYKRAFTLIKATNDVEPFDDADYRG